MIKERSISIGIVAIFLLGAVAVMPTTAAQDLGKPDFKFSFAKVPSAPVAPLQTFAVDINYEYVLKLAPQNLAGAAGSPTVDLQVNCDPAITVAGATSDVIALQSTGSDTAYDGTITIQLTIDRTAPALKSLTCDVEGGVGEVNAQGLPASNDWSNSFTVQSAYFSLLEAKTDLKLKQGGPQKQIPFALEVTNFGNGQTQVFFELKEKPSGKWQGLVPDLLLLDHQDGGRSSSASTTRVLAGVICSGRGAPGR